MKKAEVEIGGVYVVKVSNRLAAVRIKDESVYGKGWEGVNVRTGRAIRIRSAARLRCRYVPKIHAGLVGLRGES